MKRTVAFALLFLLSVALAHASTDQPSYIELPDAPTITVDWSKGNVQAVALHGNREIVFSNGKPGGRYTLIVKQDATGARLVTWPPSVRWPGQTGPTLTTLANRKDYLGFIFDDGSYNGLGISQNF